MSNQDVLEHNIVIINEVINKLDRRLYYDFFDSINSDYARFKFIYKILQSIGLYRQLITLDMVMKHIKNDISSEDE